MQPRSFVPLVAALLVACTSHERAQPAPEPSPEPDVTAPVEALDPRSPSLPEAPWRWTHFGAPEGPFADIGPREVHAGGWSCSHASAGERQAGQVCCERESQRWCATLQEDFVPGVSLASDGTRLFVADYCAISSGAQIAAHELETGKQLWTRAAVAIGPQAHSEYFNAVQLRVVDDRLIAYGDEAHGAYIEAMQPDTGALIENLRVEPPAVEWRWDDARSEPEPTLMLPDGLVCTFTIAEPGWGTLSCTRSGGYALDHRFEIGIADRGALVANESRIAVVTWNRIANGAQIHAFAGGEAAWTREVEGIGPQDHSKYSNMIQAELRSDMVVLYGREAHGRYVDAYALADGALRWSIRWPPA